MDKAEESKARYEAAMYSKPVNEREMLEAHEIGMILQSRRDLRPDEIQQLTHAKAMLESTAYQIYPY